MDDIDWRDLVDDYGPYFGLAASFAFMLWIRTLATDRVIRDGTVYFSGNDPWYHSRMVRFTVEHFPATIRFDPWSRFPYGTGRHSGFGGLFDQLIALAAMVVGAGDPSPHLIDLTTAYAPVIFGAATSILVFYFTKQLINKWGGLLAAGLLALLSGQFLSRTVIGSADHQSAEAFFGTLAVVGFVYAMHVAYTEKPLSADLIDRNWIVLRRPVIASTLGGVAMASYLMMWPPGVMVVFTLGVFIVLQSIRDYLSGKPVEYLLFPSVLSFGISGFLVLLYAKSYGLRATGFSLLQPIVFLGIAAGSALLYAIARYLDAKEYPSEYYPIGIAVGIVGTFGILAVVYPQAFGLLRDLIVRVYSFGLLTSPSSLTVAEIQPADLDAAWQAFTALFYVAIFGALVLLVRVIRGDRPTELLLLLWSFTMVSAYFTSIRFGYYVAVNVAILSAFGIWWTAQHLLNLHDLRAIEDIETYQVVGVFIILIAVVPGNVVAVDGRQPVWERAEGLAGANSAWQNELEWLSTNTPEVPLEYTDRFSPPDDGDFDYPQGAYGVMSWWDYGHWITVTGERIPFANPFQEGPGEASAYLQEANETRANLMLEALASADDQNSTIDQMSNEELRSTIGAQSDQEAGEDIRYVMIDDQMMGGKFAAIATWTGPGYGDYVSTQEFQMEGVGETANLQGVNDRYHRMMMARMYFGDASNLGHYRLVHETETTSTFVSIAQQTAGGWQSTGFINRRLSSRIFTVVQQRQDLTFYDVRQASRVKTFERVEGATLRGEVNTTNETAVFATLRLQTNTGRNFTYIQTTRTTRNGQFSMTVPYATTDDVGLDAGGTDSGLTAMGNYSIASGNPIQPTATGTARVPESAIYDGDEIEVRLQRAQTGNVTVTGG